MDIETIKIMTYVVIGGTILFVFFRKLGSFKRKCTICEGETSDAYMDSNGKLSNLCRTHLIDKWKNDVSASNSKMVFIEPDVQDKNHSMGYVYANIQQLGLWQYGKTAQDNMSKYIDTINEKNCEECGTSASIAYFKKEEYEIPQMEKITANPKYLCKNCIVKKVAPILASSPFSYCEGVYAPTDKDGVYHSQEF